MFMTISNAAKAEKFQQDIKVGLERLRGAIRMKVHPRDQTHFLDVVDRIQDAILNKAGEVETIQGQIARTKDSTRRLLRTKPVDMVQLLNELDGIEQEVVQFFQTLAGHQQQG
jgi:hypothetical protein